jgi:hypothetical protein
MIAKMIQCVGVNNSPMHPPLTHGHYIKRVDGCACPISTLDGRLSLTPSSGGRRHQGLGRCGSVHILNHGP